MLEWRLNMPILSKIKRTTIEAYQNEQAKQRKNA
jgi:hypothetical protein